MLRQFPKSVSTEIGWVSLAAPWTPFLCKCQWCFCMQPSPWLYLRCVPVHGLGPEWVEARPRSSAVSAIWRAWIGRVSAHFVHLFSVGDRNHCLLSSSNWMEGRSESGSGFPKYTHHHSPWPQGHSRRTAHARIILRLKRRQVPVANLRALSLSFGIPRWHCSVEKRKQVG